MNIVNYAIEKTLNFNQKVNKCCFPIEKSDDKFLGFHGKIWSFSAIERERGVKSLREIKPKVCVHIKVFTTS